jgi:hypothetical protein
VVFVVIKAGTDPLASHYLFKVQNAVTSKGMLKTQERTKWQICQLKGAYKLEETCMRAQMTCREGNDMTPCLNASEKDIAAKVKG